MTEELTRKEVNNFYLDDIIIYADYIDVTGGIMCSLLSREWKYHYGEITLTPVSQSL